MTKNNNCTMMDEILVSEDVEKRRYRVSPDEGEYVWVGTDLVDKIIILSGKEDIWEVEVAALLGYIKYIKKINTTRTERPARIKESTLIYVTAELLKVYCAEEIFEYIKERKWHEIVSIYESANPISALTT